MDTRTIFLHLKYSGLLLFTCKTSQCILGLFYNIKNNLGSSWVCFRGWCKQISVCDTKYAHTHTQTHAQRIALIFICEFHHFLLSFGSLSVLCKCSKNSRTYIDCPYKYQNDGSTGSFRTVTTQRLRASNNHGRCFCFLIFIML